MLNDLRYCLRSWSRSRGFVAVAIASLGLGIGLNLAVFGVFESLFVRGVTAADPSHTFHVWAGGSNRTSYPNFRDLRNAKAVDSLVAYSIMQFTYGEGDSRERIKGQAVSGDYFEMLGVQPFLGRGFSPQEKQPERAERVTLLSYPFWKQQLNGDQQILGKSIRLNGQPFTVIGVLPEGYRSLHGFASEPPFYVPYSAAVDANYADRGGHPLEMAARIAPSAQPAQAIGALQVVARELERLHPKENINYGQVRVYGISVFDQMQQPGGAKMGVIFFAILSIVVGLVLLIACANVTGLLVARAVNRRREVAVRLAMGGSRAHLVRLFLTEGFLLSLGGLGAAALLYVACAQIAARMPIPSEVPFYLHPELNWRMSLYSLLVACVAAVMCGLAPAMEASKADVSASLKNDRDASGRGRLFSLRNNLVMGQVAFSLLLLVTSLLFVRSLREVQTAKPGFNVDNQLLVTVRPDEGTSAGTIVIDTVMERLSKVQGVKSVSDAFIVPLSRSTWMTSVGVGSGPQKRAVVQANAIGRRYFTTMGIRLLAGREIDERDTKTSPAVVVVNQTFAHRFSTEANPVGRVIATQTPKGRPSESWEIVGVVADSKHETLGEVPTPVVYRPLTQEDLPFKPTIHVRTERPAVAMLSEVRSLVRDSYPSALVEVKTMAENVDQSTYPNQVGAVLLGTLGGLGVVLASIGLYGVLAYAVSRRTREIGVRMALGASVKQVLRLVLGQAMALAGIGIAAGLCMSLIATRPLSSFLSAGVSVTDPSTLMVVVAVLLLTAFTAAIVPVLRALRVNPIDALRCD